MRPPSSVCCFQLNEFVISSAEEFDLDQDGYLAETSESTGAWESTDALVLIQ